MKYAFLLALTGFAAGMIVPKVAPALARDQFKKAFVAKYVKDSPESDEDKAWAALVKKTDCLICHVGTNRKNRNEYGNAFNKLVKTKDVANIPKLNAAFDEIAGMKSKADDPASPTYGDLLKQGKLPCEPIAKNPPAETAGAK